MGPSASSVPPEGSVRCLSSALVGARLGERILPEPEGQEGGLGPGQRVATCRCAWGDRPKIP